MDKSDILLVVLSPGSAETNVGWGGKLNGHLMAGCVRNIFYQKLSKSDNWFSNYSWKCREYFFETQCITEPQIAYISSFFEYCPIFHNFCRLLNQSSTWMKNFSALCNMYSLRQKVDCLVLRRLQKWTYTRLYHSRRFWNKLATLRCHRLHWRLLYDARLQLKVTKTVPVQAECGLCLNIV